MKLDDIKLFYYLRNFARNAMPSFYFKNSFEKIKAYEAKCDASEIQNRLNYYCKVTRNFDIPKEGVKVKNFKKTKSTTYFFDLKEFFNYFKPNVSFAYHFGDETHINPYPTLFKARPITGDNANSILFKLNKRRHFQWVNDLNKFSNKKNQLVWRGKAWHQLRTDFVKTYWNHPLCEIGQVNKLENNEPWVKDFLSIEEQLKYKFIFCPEGNDVATNLKWAMSSNSLCIMPKPNFETWFMEGTLKAGVHYVEVKDDCTDLEEKIKYYMKNTAEAEQIIENANTHAKMFQDKKKEDLLCLKVLEKYAKLSGQNNPLRF